MGLNPDAMTTISREVASQIDDRIEVLGITSTEGGTDRVELLVTIAGCHQEPCTVLVNINRADPVRFEHELREKLRHAFAAHRTG